MSYNRLWSVSSHKHQDHNEPRRNNSNMTNSTKIKGIIPIVAIILSAYAMTAGARAGNGVTYPVADGAALYAAKCAIDRKSVV